MNRIEKKLNQFTQSGQKLLSPYVTAGDPEPEMTVPLMHALVESGADILELGLPFSDPMAEGPVIQEAMARALSHGMDCDAVLSMVRTFRATDAETPIILMGYLNPIEQYGYREFAKQAQAAGVDGTILVDLPPEESQEISDIWREFGLSLIYLCSPTTSDERMALISKIAQGYLYYVSLKGVTGASTFDLSQVRSDYARRKQQTTLPMMIGFGIKTPEMAANVAEFADGVIVGAALVSAVLNTHQTGGDAVQAGAALMGAMRQKMNQQTDSSGKKDE